MTALRAASDGFAGFAPLFEFKVQTVEDFAGGTLSKVFYKNSPRNGLLEVLLLEVLLQGRRLSSETASSRVAVGPMALPPHQNLLSEGLPNRRQG